MTYIEKLQSPQWQKKRLEILSRDQWSCCRCNDKEKSLHVHHKTYEFGKDPWDYHDSNFITLCEKCHSEVEYDKSIFNATIKFLLTNNISYYDLTGLLANKYWEVKATVQKEKNNG
jgi:5-methylcytosine-specific restriction endonuclease McrA